VAQGTTWAAFPFFQFLSNDNGRCMTFSLNRNGKLEQGEPFKTDRQYNGQNELEAQWTELVSPSFHSALKKRYAEPFVGVSYHISVHLATQFQRRRFFKKSTNHK
jgi:hypothetical protein